MTELQMQRMKEYQRGSNIPPACRKWLLSEIKPRDAFQKKYVSMLSDLLEKKSLTVTVCGTEGTGKTMIACAAINTALIPFVNGEGRGKEPYYITQSEMNMMFRSAMNSRGSSEFEVFQMLSDRSLLVIDEVGRSRNSEYQMENLEALISKRYAWNRPTVLISNDSAEELTQLFDRHILDRLNCGGSIEMHGVSQRGK